MRPQLIRHPLGGTASIPVGLWLNEEAPIRLRIKVVPGSSRDGIAGWLGEALKICVTAPAEGGRANSAVEAILAEALGLGRGSTRVVQGKTSPRKVVEIIGLTEQQVCARLGRGDD